MNGIIKLTLLMILIISCSSQKIFETSLSSDDLEIWIENDSLIYDVNFDYENRRIQTVRFKIINHSEKTYVMPFNTDFFSTYQEYSDYLRGSQNKVNRNYNFAPFFKLISKNGEIIFVEPGEIDSHNNCDNLMSKEPDLIIIRPYSYESFEMDIGIPYYEIDCFFTTYTQSSFSNSLNFFTPGGVKNSYAQITYRVDNWVGSIDKNTLKNFQGKKITLYEGNITSNKIPIVLFGN